MALRNTRACSLFNPLWKITIEQKKKLHCWSTCKMPVMLSQILLYREQMYFGKRLQQELLTGQHRFSPAACKTGLAGKKDVLPAATTLLEEHPLVHCSLSLEQPTCVQWCASALIKSRSRDWKPTSSADNFYGIASHFHLLLLYWIFDVYEQLLLQQ